MSVISIFDLSRSRSKQKKSGVPGEVSADRRGLKIPSSTGAWDDLTGKHGSMQREAPEESSGAPGIESIEMTPESFTRSLRILLVEDNEHDRFAFARALKREENGVFDIYTLEKGEDAVTLLSSDPSKVDVVVVDYDLPGINGMSIFEDLKDRLGETRLPPFVMLTGAGNEDLATNAIKKGMYDYLVKDPDDRYLRLVPTILIAVYRRHSQRLAYLEAQQQLARAHRDLEEKVEERTRQLSHTVNALRAEVTERRDAQEALVRSRQRIRELSMKAIEAQENERKAIAQELHDSVGGNLAAIKMSLEMRIDQMGDPPKNCGLPLETIVGHLKDTIDEVRRITARLRPRNLDRFGLIGAINETCRRIEEQYGGISITPKIDIPEAEVQGHLKLVLYRVFQEALNNAAKHSSAKSVRVGLSKDGDNVQLTVEDDGSGFNPEKYSDARGLDGGYGLKSMQERSELNGGRLYITSAPGAGTKVEAVFPLTES